MNNEKSVDIHPLISTIAEGQSLPDDTIEILSAMSTQERESFAANVEEVRLNIEINEGKRLVMSGQIRDIAIKTAFGEKIGNLSALELFAKNFDKDLIAIVFDDNATTQSSIVMQTMGSSDSFRTGLWVNCVTRNGVFLEDETKARVEGLVRGIFKTLHPALSFATMAEQLGRMGKGVVLYLDQIIEDNPFAEMMRVGYDLNNKAFKKQLADGVYVVYVTASPDGVKDLAIEGGRVAVIAKRPGQNFVLHSPGFLKKGTPNNDFRAIATQIMTLIDPKQIKPFMSNEEEGEEA